MCLQGDSSNKQIDNDLILATTATIDSLEIYVAMTQQINWKAPRKTSETFMYANHFIHNAPTFSRKYAQIVGSKH